MQFESYFVVPLRDLGEHCEECDAEHADFWGLYGVDDSNRAYAIGDFSTKSDAEFISEAIQAS